jgi:hypothetical protein
MWLAGNEGFRFMRSATLIGVALVVFGVFALVYHGFTYKTQKRVLEVGPIEATKEEHKTIPLPPVLGAMALVGGMVLIARDRR